MKYLFFQLYLLLCVGEDRVSHKSDNSTLRFNKNIRVAVALRDDQSFAKL